MTENEETLVYDAMRAIKENAGIMAAFANTDGTPKARVNSGSSSGSGSGYGSGYG